MRVQHNVSRNARTVNTLDVDEPGRLWTTVESVNALDKALEDENKENEEDEFTINAKIAFENGDLNNFYKTKYIFYIQMRYL